MVDAPLHGIMKAAITIDPRDDLAVALRDLSAGEAVDVNGETITILEEIEAKQKFATHDFAIGDRATQYGVTVGKATQPIERGGLISTANLVHDAHGYSLEDRKAVSWEAPDVSHLESMTFDGFHRENGSVGTGNYWIVIPMVFCENRNVEVMREALIKPFGYGATSHYESLGQKISMLCKSGADADAIRAFSSQGEDGASAEQIFPNVDGVKFLTHGLGCGGTRGDSTALCSLLAGYATHPNVAGTTVLSLGCQNAEVATLQTEIAKRDPNYSKPLHIFVQQEWESEREMMEAAIRDTVAGMAEANQLERKPAPLSKLIFGAECGGSDGFSGVSANPTVGRVSDLLVALGGSVILSEFPELCGVEQELVNRCVSDEVARDFTALMDSYNRAAEAVGAKLSENPSPGNIRDGLITDAIKSAGAAKKGGTSPVTAAFDYPEWVRTAGLNLMNTPGNDVESTTAMAGAHANVIVFTTGLGTPTGNPVTPVIKIASNTKLAESMSDIIDFDCGPIIRGETGIEELAETLLQLVIDVASGRRKTKAQILGQDDFLPWKRGVSL